MAKIFKFTAHCVDSFYGRIIDSETGQEVEYEGYVPSGIGIGGGDDVIIAINLETGQIIKWQPVTDEQLDKALNPNGE